MHFGEHLTIDGYEGDLDLLNDRDVVHDCLSELPRLLDMKILASPEVYHAEGNDKKDPGGWTGFVVIEESHISIHTFPKRGFVSIDVYTCQEDMNQELAKEFFTKKFKLKEIETNFLKRGTKYPDQDIY